MSGADDVTVSTLIPGPLVLVVDDELAPRAAVSRMIRGFGYRARSCSTGRDALRFLKAHLREVRLVVADFEMPRMDGGELAERALDLDPSVRVLLMSGPADGQADELLAGYRDFPFLAKPVSCGRANVDASAEL